MTALLIVQCRHCNRRLRTVAEAPESWDGVLSFRGCPCQTPSPERIVDVLVQKDMPAWPLVSEIAWVHLRADVERAWRTGKPTRVLA